MKKDGAQADILLVIWTCQITGTSKDSHDNVGITRKETNLRKGRADTPRQRQYDYEERNNNTWRSHTASQRQNRHQNDKDSVPPVPWQSEYSWNQQAMFDRNCTAHPHYGTTEETSQPFMTQAPMYDTEEHYAHAASYRHSYNDWYQQNPDVWNDWHRAHYTQHVSATNLYQPGERQRFIKPQRKDHSPSCS
ncbi:hypothetical protein ACOMHN_042246 [Nucella lapillus]